MTLDEAKKYIGRKVYYKREKETGEITSVSSTFVFVRYEGREGTTYPGASKATRPQDLELLPDDEELIERLNATMV